MEEARIQFERKIYPQLKQGFTEAISDEDRRLLVPVFENLIENGDFKGVIEKIKSLENFTKHSFFLHLMKLDWWQEFLTGNMHRSKDGTIELTDMEGNILQFNTLEEVYRDFIAVSNESIWTPYHNVFTKIFTEWCVEAIISAGRKTLPIKRLEFVNNTILEIEKELIFEKYAGQEINEHLQFYKSILELSLKDPSLPKGIYQNEKVFSGLTSGGLVARLLETLEKSDFETFFTYIKTIYASVPYQIFRKIEAYFHSIFHTILFLISTESRSEEATNHGRIDSVIETESNIILFEFKLKSAAEGLRQMKQKKYYQKFIHKGKSVYLISTSFDIMEKTVKEWLAEKVNA